LTAGQYDFIIEQGATFQRVFAWTDSDDQPVDLTGYTARLQVRRSTSSSTIYLDLSSEAPGGGDTFIQAITIDALAGTLTVDVDADVTAALTWTGAAAYDLEVTALNGIVTRLLEGSVLLSKEVTRDDG